MNPVELLIWNHDRSGSAKSFLLTRAELDEIVEAAIQVGQDGIDALEEAAYDSGYENAKDEYECECDTETQCWTCGYSDATLCQPCAGKEFVE